MGFVKITLRILTVCASIALLVMLLALRSLYESWSQPAFIPSATPNPQQANPTESAPVPAYGLPANASFERGISRLARLHTILPERPRFEITHYEVKQGDTLFGIAEMFQLKPQTILFGNADTMFDDPHRLSIGQKLNILPVDGMLYTWNVTDGLNGVAKFFKVTPDDIINWPGNHLSYETIGDLSKPNIAKGTVLLIPGGTRDYRSWSAPLISRKDPAKAAIFGPGYCGTIVDGYYGSGSFVWPSTEHWISGFDYSPDTNHWGIDIAGQTGNPIYASDSGVVVYAGLNNWGYGYVIVIDHGNGYQTLYAHLSQLYVGCGASVAQGATVAALGSTGNSSGPHLHFEIMNASGVRVNPWGYVSK